MNRRISTNLIDPVTIQDYLWETMSTAEWTELFRLTEQMFLRHKNIPGVTNVSQSDLEEDKIQSAEALEYKKTDILKGNPQNNQNGIDQNSTRGIL